MTQPMRSSSHFFNIGAYLTAIVALLDQTSKWWITEHTLRYTYLHPVTSFLNFRLNWNKGVTFGLFNDFNEWMPYILIAVALVILILLLNWLRKATTLYAALGLGLIMGGAIGNVIDRIKYGSVVDFLDFHVMGYHWYTFNLADSAIVVGVGLLMIENLAMRRKKS